MGSLWNRSGMVERYADDLRAAGAKAYFFNGGTTTPLTVFQDSGESAAHANPVLADASGRWPDVFVPYIVSFDVQVKSADNVQLTYSLEIPNPDPIELTVTIPAEERVATGMIHAEMINSTKAGYVRLNGRTIGNSLSSATERANTDTLALFTYLWNSLPDSIAPVSGGRGGDAGSDFSPGNKNIGLPNWQGSTPLGLDDMGAVAGGFLAVGFYTGNSTTPGSRTGINGIALTEGNLPIHSHSGTTGTEGLHTHTGTTGVENQSHTHSGTTAADGSHTHTVTITDPQHTHTASSGSGFKSATIGTVGVAASGAGGAQVDIASASTGISASVPSSGAHQHTITTGNASLQHLHSFTSDPGSAHSHTFTTDTKGSNIPFNNLARSFLVTWFIKL